MYYSLNVYEMQLVELNCSFLTNLDRLLDQLKYICICNLIITSIVFEIWLKWTSRLRMWPSFPEGGNGDVKSSDWRKWDLAREPNHLRVLTEQANDSWHACFAKRTLPRSVGIKGEHVQTHISFSLRSRDCVPRPYSGGRLSQPGVRSVHSWDGRRSLPGKDTGSPWGEP